MTTRGSDPLRFLPSMEPTTTLPSSIDMDALLPELNSPQERYDHGYKRGYLAGYAEGARQALAERAADLASEKNASSATQARAKAALCSGSLARRRNSTLPGSARAKQP